VESAAFDTRPVGPEDLPDLATLFGGSRNTRRCWCTAFCTTRSQFAVGWVTGRNQHRFESMARDSTTPMGVLASSSGEPVGWCACGPRSRYAVADGGRSKLLRDRDRDEDTRVWFLACIFVRTDHRGEGVSHALVRAAIELARREGAVAIEAWPVVGSEGTAEAFVGRERVLEDLGFRVVARPTPRRSIMRLQFRGN
jgi:GNAT superfamily N-acetyltransferase